MEWIAIEDRLPPFDERVLVYCRIYGRYIGAYQRIDPDYDFGNWNDGEKLGVLPPTHWMPLPPAPHKKAIHKDGCKNLIASQPAVEADAKCCCSISSCNCSYRGAIKGLCLFKDQP